MEGAVDDCVDDDVVCTILRGCTSCLETTAPFLVALDVDIELPDDGVNVKAFPSVRRKATTRAHVCDSRLLVIAVLSWGCTSMYYMYPQFINAQSSKKGHGGDAKERRNFPPA
jgi:hypothetical protein